MITYIIFKYLETFYQDPRQWDLVIKCIFVPFYFIVFVIDFSICAYFLHFIYLITENILYKLKINRDNRHK